MYSASEAEQEVLNMLWEQEGDGIRQPKLLALFEASGKEWKRQTLNTFLSRLEEKGLVTRENRIVKTVYSRDEYNCMRMKAAIDEMYGGRLSNFLAAFVNENTLSAEEAQEMIRILEKF